MLIVTKEQTAVLINMHDTLFGCHSLKFLCIFM